MQTTQKPVKEKLNASNGSKTLSYLRKTTQKPFKEKLNASNRPKLSHISGRQPRSLSKKSAMQVTVQNSIISPEDNPEEF
ncbi:hypothetical protein J6590_004620 [Homalodisca vitripennis]|nr:hypothetical protein J6590_004620 [Homalodisca vitripennis]